MDRQRRIVALAGTLCSPRIFDPLADGLSDVATIEAVSWMTLPGPWDVPTLASRVVEHIRVGGRNAVTLVGHSTGGAIALQLALDQPELVDGLVLIDTGPNMHAHGDVDKIIESIEVSWGPQFFAAILERSFMAPLEPRIRDSFLAYAGAVDPRAASQVLTSQRQMDFQDRLGEIGTPTVVIHGTEDPTRTIAHAQHFASAIPNAQLYLLRCGHSPMFEQPGEVAAIIRPLLESGT